MNSSLLGKIGRALGSRAAGIRSGVLTLGGLGLLTAGAFQYALWSGLVVAGIGLFTLDWFFSAERAQPERR